MLTALPYVVVASVVLFLLRSIFVAGRKAARVDLHGKTILVTGASPGSIGFETARILASWGARVVITTRSNPDVALDAIRARLPDANARERMSAHPLDLSRAESVEAFVAWLGASNDTLDVLVNNAGVHLDLLSQWTEPSLAPDGHEIHWRTNYLGTAHLTERLLPSLLRTASQRGEARIVNVVSHLHAMAKNDQLFTPTRAYDSWRAYGGSKLALVHATSELERRYGARGVHAYSLHPGSVYSRIADKGLEGSRTMAFLRRVLAPIERSFLKTITEGAQTSVHCATSPDAKVGAYHENCRPHAPSPEANDVAIAARLFDETEAWTASLSNPRETRGASA